MALAKKCDRCEKLYEHYPLTNKNQYNSVERVMRTSDGNIYRKETSKDLCPDCMKKFNKFMEGIKFSNDKNEDSVTGSEINENSDLYLILNQGCDDTTKGLAFIPKTYFDKFKSFIEDLNTNSTYECMPIIKVYKIDENMIRPAETEDDDILYLNGNTYVIKDNSIFYTEGRMEQVI